MCGIGGILSTVSRDDIPLTARKMVDVMRHRGPDGSGVVCFDGLGRRRDEAADAGEVRVALAHTRLAILDVTDAGAQPLCSADTRYWIVYNGEVYNYIELREQLVAHGHTFRSNTDTEVVLAAYVQWGADFLDRLNGMFALAIWDSLEKRLFCACDRFGIKPFYYAFGDSWFAFGSEIKAIGSAGLLKPALREDRMVDYLATGRVIFGSDTFWQGVFRLQPGESLVYLEGRIRARSWYTPSVTIGGEEPDLERLDELITDSVRLRLRSDVPVGACLSGGIDSGLITTTMRRLLGPNAGLKTFTVVGAKAVVDGVRVGEDWQRAEELSRRLGTDHETIRVDEAIGIDEVVEFIHRNDEPIRSSGSFNQHVVMKAVGRRGVKVLLDGQGGDEVFLGYFLYYGWVLQDAIRRGAVSTLLDVGMGMIAHRSCTLRNLAVHAFSDLTLPARHLWNQHWLRRLVRPTIPLPDLRARREAENGGCFEERRIREIFGHQLSWLLRDEDMNSMASSVEARVPFLDHRIVEYALSVGGGHLMRHGWSKYLLRQAAAKSLPASTAWNRLKSGFYFDIADRLHGLPECVLDGLGAGRALDGLLDMRNVERLLRSRRLPGHLAWRLLCLAVFAGRNSGVGRKG